MIVLYNMAKFISTSLVLVFFLVAIMIYGAYSDYGWMPRDECQLLHEKCLLIPKSTFCDVYSMDCSYLGPLPPP
jgi:hypothetical protein